MTSSAPVTRANSYSELKLRGAGQAAAAGGPVRAAAATRGAAHEIADKPSIAMASRATALSCPRVTILTTLPPAPVDDLSGPAAPGLAGPGPTTPAVSSSTSSGEKNNPNLPQ